MICTELNIHTRLEEEIFYPACREAIDDEDLMDEAQVEHDAAKLLIADLTVASGDDPYLDAKVKLLSEMNKHHVAEEEKRGEGVFAKAEQHQVDNVLGPRCGTHRAQAGTAEARCTLETHPRRFVQPRPQHPNGGGFYGEIFQQGSRRSWPLRQWPRRLAQPV